MRARKIHAADHLSGERVEEYVRLALSGPDDELLDRYFEECVRDVPSPLRLTDAEGQWITANLQENGSWKEAWRQKERSLGQRVDWRGHHAAWSHGWGAHDRSPIRRRAIRRSAAVALSLAAVYAVFWIGGRLLLTQTYQWASVDEYQYVLDRQTRSTGSNSEDSFAEGAAELLKAPRTTLGLFPSYDEDRVERAIGSLREAYASTDDSFQRAEIAFFLAKAHLMKKDVAEARRWLGEIIALDVADYRAEAEQLLEAMSNADAADRRPR